ncbi:hypothetical protein PLAN_120260 [Planktothrix rubescens CCAP 1459/22]|uniref:Uncharacterized protein n=1 Tax=Planktothrix rubescens CCAP 1459/22 TaxID=329571 RepID=A0A6J7ZHM0_PLARU|nr:hypothetical protein PLAN_120260 [Planktothrix rubescens NIVA-CYA 18]
MWAELWDASWITVPERCSAKTLIKKQHQSGQPQSQYPNVEQITITTAPKNISSVVLKPSSAARYSLGTVSGLLASDITVCTP